MAQSNDSLDRSLLQRLRRQIQTTDAESLLNAASDDLLTFIRTTPLIYGFWADFKRLYKAAEKASPLVPTAALLARLATADLPRHSPYLPEAPLAHQINGPGRVAVSGEYAYVLNLAWNTNGLHVVDISSPAQPTIVAHIKLQGVVDLAVEGSKLYLLVGTSWNTTGRVSCYDISDPNHPRPESSIEVAHGTRIAVSEARVAVLTNGSRNPDFQLFDASQSGQLRLLSRLGLTWPVAMQIAGDTVYVVNSTQRGRGDNRLIVVDIALPSQPRQMQEIAIPPTTDLAIQGRYAYLACSKGRNALADAQTGLTILDLDPGQGSGTGLRGAANWLKSLIAPLADGGPKQTARLPLGNVQNVVVQGTHAYVTVGRERYTDKKTGGLRVIDISDPSKPQVKGVFSADEAGAIAITGQTICLNVSSQRQNRFRILDVSDPARPLLFGAPPGRETLGYMKRRGRRLLHNLALRDPERYVRAAAQVLLEAGQAQPELDPRTQWISMDLLYGGGTRFVQRSHGRGSYGALRSGLSLRTREERCPELWDRHPELAEQLYTTPKLPWQTWEAAAKILRSANTPLPALNDRMLTGFLASDSPLLRALAGRQVTGAVTAGRKIAADIAADVYFGGTRRQRAVIGQFTVGPEAETRWRTAFAIRLYQRAAFVVKDVPPPRKATLAFALLIAHFPALFQQDILPQTAVALYRTGRPDFNAWALEVYRRLPPMQLSAWLEAIRTLPFDLRETAVQAILTGFGARALPATTLAALIRHSDAWVRQSAWKIAANSSTTQTDIASVWAGLLDEKEPTPALRAAFESPDALALFSRCAFDSRLMADRLNAHPFLIPLLPSAALEKVVAVLPPDAVLRLVQEASDMQWPGLRSAILLGPLLPPYRAVFWSAAFAAIGAIDDPILSRRLLADAMLQTAFLDLPDIREYLRSANPVFGPLLGQWIAAHADRLHRGSADLLQIAIHPLPEIRQVGLKRVQEVGMDLPFALRLLESELPPSVALGKTFFDALNANEERRTEAITALCDSPRRSVRAYGREVMTGRPEVFAETDILKRLTENPDPETQAFVAGQLLRHSPPSERTRAFDSAVLRARDRGRRAKELVKTRLENEPTADIALLLEMARSRTARDADWALGQLAKLALEGIEIPGFTLDGVAGG
jgi:hypothetical protein